MAAPSRQWASQAKINALLRYSPQREALANLTQEARDQYATSIKGAESAGRLTSQAVEQAKPEVSGIYDRAQGSTSATQQQLAAALAALGPAASGFKAAAATTGAAGSERGARERSAAESNLESQDVAAKEAPGFARTLANQQLATSLSKIFSSTQSVAENEGAATASELGKLEDEAEGRRVTERGQNLTSQSSAASRSQKAKEHQEDLAQKRAGGSTTLTLSEQNKGASVVQQIRQFALEGGNDRAERVAALTEGRPAQSAKNKQGATVKTPAIPAFKPDVLMSAALDWAEHGHLTANTEHRLTEAGYDVSKLGIPRASKNAAGKLGERVQSAVGGF